MPETSITLPVNLRVSGRLCLIVGAGCVALRKARKLIEHGARLRVVAPYCSPSWQELGDRVQVVARAFDPADLEGACLVIAATDDPDLNRRIAAGARDTGVWALAVNAPEAGDLSFPATLRRGDLTVSFATDGASPALAAHLRQEAEKRYGDAHAAFCKMARRLRNGEVRHLPASAREAFFRALVDSSVLDLLASGRTSEAQRLALEVLWTLDGACPAAGNSGNGQRLSSVERAPGVVFLIGAGPGDPGLLTIKAADRLRQADAVLYDSMVNPAMLELHCSHAELFDVGKRKGCCKRSQDEITSLMIELARQGRTVARLKGGDPMIFGRGGEEARALHEAGVHYEIVPGVSCVAAAPAYAGIPVTDRDYSSSVGIYTVHRRGGLALTDDRWRSIAQGPDTLVFLMGKTRAAQLVEKLIEFGRAPSTPIALICDGTLPHQSRWVGTLESFHVDSGELPGPGMIVVGEVVRVIPQMDWFPAACARNADHVRHAVVP